MSNDARHLARIGLTCPSCKQKTEEQVIQLVDRNTFPCSFCSYPIDLKHHDAEIKKALAVYKKIMVIGPD